MSGRPIKRTLRGQERAQQASFSSNQWSEETGQVSAPRLPAARSTPQGREWSSASAGCSSSARD